MSEINYEKLLETYPIPVTINSTKIILKQMENCVCKINNSNGKGTGFFCYIPYNNKNLPVLIANNHIINEEIIKKNNNIKVTLNDDKEEINIKINDNRKIYTSKIYDITIIEIRPEKDKIHDITKTEIKQQKSKMNEKNFLELDKSVFDNDQFLYNENIYIIQYPKYLNKQEASVSYGILKEIQEEYNIVHLCSTKKGSSGSPILSLENNKVIGIHKESSNDNFNKGVFLKYSINEYLNNTNLIKKEIKNNIIDINKNMDNEYLKIINHKFEEEPKNLKYKLDITNSNIGYFGCNDVFEVFISYKDKKEYIVSRNKSNLDLFTLLDNKKIRSLKGHREEIITIRYFINYKDFNEYLISADYYKKVIIWDITNNYNIKYEIYNNSRDSIFSCLLIFPQNISDNYIITSTNTKSENNDKSATNLYSLNNGKFIKYFNNTNNTIIYYLLSWYNKEDNKYYIIQIGEKIIINNLLEDELYSEFKYETESENSDLTDSLFSGFIYNKDNNDYLCTSTHFENIIIWDLYNKELFKVIKVKECILYHIIQWNEKYILVADYMNKSIKIIDIENEKISDINTPHTEGIICIKKIYNPQYGESLLSASHDKTIKLWSIK